MAETIRFRIAYRSPVARVRESICRPHDHRCGGEEYSEDNSIVFVRRGVFVRHLDGREIIADANQVHFFQRGEAYRVSHPVAGGDDCFSFAVPDSTLLEMFRVHDPTVDKRPERPFRINSIPSSARLDLGQRALVRAMSRGSGPDLEVDELILTLLGRVVGESIRAHGTAPRRRRADTVQAHRELANAVQTELARRPCEPLALSDLARSVHSSPFHLCRVFQTEVGMSIHQYCNRLRLRAALERLADGEPDTTSLALDLGYSSRGHFSDAFRREFGLAPTVFRRLATGRLLRELSKIMGA